MEQQSEGLDLERASGVLRRRGWLVVVCVLLCAAAAYGLAERETKRYTATASIAFTNDPLKQQVSGLPPVGSSAGSVLAQQANDVEAVRLGDTAAKTAAELGGPVSEREVARSVSVAAAGESGIVTVTASAATPKLASSIANTYVRVFTKEQQAGHEAYLRSALASVHRQLSALSHRQQTGADGLQLQNRAQTLRLLRETGYGEVSVAGEAPLPTAPASPRPLRNTLLGAALGLLLGLGLVFALDRLDRRLRNARELEALYRAPVLAALPRLGTVEDDPAIKESLGLVCAQLRSMQSNGPLRTIVVTSAAPGEGKSTVAAGLARAAAALGVPTLLIEADLRRPSLAGRLGLIGRGGLVDVLSCNLDVSSAIQTLSVSDPNETSGTRLGVLTAGASAANPAALLGSSQMRSLIAWAASAHQLVLIDAPAVVVADTLTIVDEVDGVLAVGRVDQVRREQVERAAVLLARAGTRLVGVVANGCGEQESVRSSYAVESQLEGAAAKPVLAAQARS
jgi:polysaccharide biosynthesis transport protein